MDEHTSFIHDHDVKFLTGRRPEELGLEAFTVGLERLYRRADAYAHAEPSAIRAWEDLGDIPQTPQQRSK